MKKPKRDYRIGPFAVTRYQMRNLGKLRAQLRACKSNIARRLILGCSQKEAE